MSEYQVLTQEGYRKLPADQRFLLHVNLEKGLLTPYQEVVMAMKMNGLIRSQIAEILVISEETVKKHISNSYERFAKLNDGHGPVNIVDAICILAANGKVQLTLESNNIAIDFINNLTIRQNQVVLNLSNGGTQQEVADDIAVKYNTIKKHMRDITQNLKANRIDLSGNRLEKLLILDTLGIIELPFISNRIKVGPVIRITSSYFNSNTTVTDL